MKGAALLVTLGVTCFTPGHRSLKLNVPVCVQLALIKMLSGKSASSSPAISKPAQPINFWVELC